MSYVPQLKSVLNVAQDALMFAEQQYMDNLKLFKADELPAEAMDAYHRELIRAESRVRHLKHAIAKEIEEEKFYNV